MTLIKITRRCVNTSPLRRTGGPNEESILISPPSWEETVAKCFDFELMLDGILQIGSYCAPSAEPIGREYNPVNVQF